MININGKQYEGNNISINNGKVTIDDKQIETDTNKITLINYGKLESFSCDRSVNVEHNLQADKIDVKGSLNCDNVEGNITAGGSVNCDDVKGNIKAGGSVNCDKVEGKVL